MVDLDKVDQEDIDELKTMIQKHYAYTASTVAKFVLDDFENQLKNFVKVFPRDYKKVLQSKKEKVQSAK
jgi:glutamate synthase (NADPH/NADH) large chain